MDKIKKTIPGLKVTNGLDPFWVGTITTTKDGLVPVFIPDLKDSSSRILDEVLITDVISHVRDLDDTVHKVIVYYVDISGLDIVDRYIDKANLDKEIELRDLKEIIDEFYAEDEMIYEIKNDRTVFPPGISLEVKSFYSDAVKKRIDSFNLKNSQADKKGKFKPITLSDTGLELIEMISLDCSEAEGPWHSDREVKIGIDSKVIIDGTKTKDYWDGKVRCERMPMRIKVRNICGDETILQVH